eukprot:1080969-Rhodomonas_salina.5
MIHRMIHRPEFKNTTTTQPHLFVVSWPRPSGFRSHTAPTWQFRHTRVTGTLARPGSLHLRDRRLTQSLHPHWQAPSPAFPSCPTQAPRGESVCVLLQVVSFLMRLPLPLPLPFSLTLLVLPSLPVSNGPSLRVHGPPPGPNGPSSSY